MSNNGYFLVYRKLFDHEIGQNPLAVALWVRLLSEASYEDKKVYWDGKAIEIKRGQLITSIDKLSKWLGVTWVTTKRITESYQKIGQIKINSTNKYTVITICNYDKYQVKSEQNIEQTIEQTKNKMHTTKEYKEIKEYKEGDIVLTKKQLESLQRQFPYLDVPYKLQKFKEWQRSTGVTFKNSLARFRLWLLEDAEKQEKTTNVILLDPIFENYKKVFRATEGGAFVQRSRLESLLGNKYPDYKYKNEWIEARVELNKTPTQETEKKDDQITGFRSQLVQHFTV